MDRWFKNHTQFALNSLPATADDLVTTWLRSVIVTAREVAAVHPNARVRKKLHRGADRFGEAIEALALSEANGLAESEAAEQ